jgi:uncharacterized GH25 family protein
MKTTVAAALLSLAAPCLAHDTWLSLSGSTPGPGGRVAFELTSAGGFPKPESAVAAGRLARTGLRLAGSSVPHEPQPSGKQALRLAAPLTGAGSAVAWVETRPRTLKLTAEQLAHYLEEVGAGETLSREWKNSGLSTWRESYVKLAKTVFRVGADSGDRAWAEPLGLDLEFVPDTDPSSLRSGDTLSVRLLWKGLPLVGSAVGAASRGRSLPLRHTDADGRVALAIDAEGPWLIRATRIERAPLPDADWQSWFATLTFTAAAGAGR